MPAAARSSPAAGARARDPRPEEARLPRPTVRHPCRPFRSTVWRAARLLLVVLLPVPLAAQQNTPRTEDAELPAQGELRIRIAPIFQGWHQEYGGGSDGSAAVPLADDWSGPLLDQVYPGPDPLVEGLNRAADSLGFTPLLPADVSAGELEMREMDRDVRSVPFRLEFGILDRLALDVMVPLMWTETETFSNLDLTAANLAPAAEAFEQPDLYFTEVASARTLLETRIESGSLTPEEEAQATALLATSGAFVEALRARVIGEGLLPAAGSTPGDQVAAHYASLVAGFSAFDVTLPAFSLPQASRDGLFGALGLPPIQTTNRGPLFGEAEAGLRLLVLDGFRRHPEERSWLEARTAVGARLRFDVRSPNSTVFIDPDDLLGIPLGDGQRDLEFSLYQDLRFASTLLVNVVARYGIQQPDELSMRLRSPERPLAPPSAETRVERDPGDYRRLRVAPRLVLNPVVSLGAEYRYWHKEADVYRSLEEGVDATVLERETAQTLHRVGFGAFYRPDPPGKGEGPGAVPELGFIYQRAIAGSGGETRTASLVTFHLRIPIRLF